ncbi:cell division topological specificity factor MinE [Kingella negevensis]|uniref:Cell division topological specificity factor n=1 Tax=Kingella negevensis TaxID=1522312 RepID=A0A238TBI1_9NEIS|nr:cell division topological specificity factor MinE [Kingella negevensis]MDK4681127.1 cell division topological specificity factor MinE [Kingella negevensis]MDK4683329.1 cell division topological specificity factor MinE [Kingella negevensis]MDK4684334.1 cell division topological specificity factor MinE [Kingella negevensis]MDK4688183.1 cell division topological specificity factor MinE [Kingella negevensis]MDK4691540.1 cell division topological specificity factor MinE [Kingella negevensis]
MSLIDKLFGKKPKTATLARDRLQIIITQERASRDAESNTPDYLPTLQKELLEVLSKYVKIELNDINISREEQDGVEMLALNITLPETKAAETQPENAETPKSEEEKA